MKRIIKTLLIVLVSGIVFSQTLIETGYLRNASGQPITGVYQMRFQIYPYSIGGVSIWDSNYLSVSVNDGLYTVQLGSPGQPTLDQTIFSSTTDYYMGVEIDGDVFPSRELIAYHARAIQADFAISASTANYALMTNYAVTSDVSQTSNYSVDAGLLGGKPEGLLSVSTANVALTANTANYAVTSDYASTSNFANDAGLLGGKPEGLLSVSTANVAVTASNALMLSGQQGSYYQDAANINTGNLSLSRLSSVVVTDNYFGSITVNGTIKSTFFVGDGSMLTGVGGLSGVTLSDIVTRDFHGDVTVNGDISALFFRGQLIGTANTTMTANYAIESSTLRHRSLPIISIDTILLLEDTFPLVDASAHNVIIYLPTVTSAKGRQFQIKRVDMSAHDVIVLGYSGEKIEGYSSYRLTTKDEFVILISDGSNWLISGNN